MIFLEQSGQEQGVSSLDNVLKTVQAFHEKQSNLCDRLEGLADSLPDNFNAQEALVLARQIMPVICESHRFEEDVLFELVNDASSNQSLERLKFEHWEDEASGEDLTDALLSYGCNPDAKKH